MVWMGFLRIRGEIMRIRSNKDCRGVGFYDNSVESRSLHPNGVRPSHDFSRGNKIIVWKAAASSKRVAPIPRLQSWEQDNNVESLSIILLPCNPYFRTTR